MADKDEMVYSYTLTLPAGTVVTDDDLDQAWVRDALTEMGKIYTGESTLEPLIVVNDDAK